MLIAQITDVHIGFEADNPTEFNHKRLNDVLDCLIEGPNRPDLLLATGDLTDKGETDSYCRLAESLNRCPFPVSPSIGNHDLRANFHAQFPGLRDPNGFVQYVTELESLRLVTIDTLEEGRHGGAFCEMRAQWLESQLAADYEKVTYIVMHHPPVASGIEWMNTDPREPWVARFTEVLMRHPQVRGLICGHLHRSAVIAWHGRTIAICSSVAPQVALDLRSLDYGQPDDRPMIVAENPAYALHYWNSQELVSFFLNAGNYTELARYDQKFQQTVNKMKAERPV